MNLCSVPHCQNSSLKRGMCNAHYLRWWKYGDPLKGSTPWREAQRYLHEVVFTYEGDECLAWPFSKNRHGYGQIRIDGHLHLVSRLACEEENGPPPSINSEAAHSCGNGHLACATRRHLRWATRSENRQDMINHGRSNRGKKSPFVKLEADQVQEIRALLGTKSNSAIAAQFGVDPSTISSIKIGRAWAWLKGV